MEYKDYYKILGVPKTATKAEIRKAYRKLARQHHPDVKPGDKKAEQTFKDLNEAHTVLADADKRKRYDTLGPNWDAYGPPRSDGGRPGASASGGGGPFGGFGDLGGRNVRYEFRTSGDGGDLGGFSDFFRMMFGGEAQEPATSRRSTRTTRTGTATADFDDLFSQLRNEGSTASAARQRETRTTPPPVEATAEITLEEAFHGTTRLVQVDDKRLEVKIPRGVDTGSRIRLKGQAGNDRDLFVVIRVRPHAAFTRRGADLEHELPISLREALLGGQVHVTTLKGRVLLTIPEGTQSGRTFRLTGQGMPRFKADGAGDLYARVRVVLPTNLSDEAREAARRLLDLAPQPDPR